MADICATYLSFNQFKHGISLTNTDFEERLKMNPFYEYATQNWGHRARSSAVASQVATTFLGSTAHVEAASQGLLAVTKFRSSEYSQAFERDMANLHLAALFGIYGVVDIMLNLGTNIDSKTKHGRAPLSLAASGGFETVVELLLATGKVDINSKHIDGGTPLLSAVEGGHESVVKLLLTADNIDIDCRDNNGQTPLLAAASLGHDTVVKLLLQKGMTLWLSCCLQQAKSMSRLRILLARLRCQSVLRKGLRL